MNEKLKLFKIEIDDIENIDFENGMLQKIARQCADEMDLKRFELVLNENIITAKDKFTGIHSYMAMRVSLEPLEKDISFIVRPTNEPTYEDLSKENKKYKEVIDKIDKYINDYNVFEVFSFPLMKRWEEEQVKSSIDYEFKTSLIKDLKDILKEVE